MTRPEPGASETARRLAMLGRAAVVAPLLRVQPLAFTPPPGIAAVLITSGNAVPCLPPSLYGTLLLAVGNATAERARVAGFSNVHSADGDATALAAFAGERCLPGTTLLLATARRQGTTLAAALRDRGFAVHRRAVYTAQPATRMPPQVIQALRGGSLDAALFLSGETAGAFVRLLPMHLASTLANVDALAIGEPAAEALRVLPWRRVRVSAKPTLDSILALL